MYDKIRLPYSPNETEYLSEFAVVKNTQKAKNTVLIAYALKETVFLKIEWKSKLRFRMNKFHNKLLVIF
jgi:hypothetical protein